MYAKNFEFPSNNNIMCTLLKQKQKKAFVSSNKETVKATDKLNGFCILGKLGFLSVSGLAKFALHATAEFKLVA